MRITVILVLLWISGISIALGQPATDAVDGVAVVKRIEHTPVKDQAGTSTCWSFATLSLVESQTLRASLGAFDLSEMYIVRNIYMDKAKNYVLRQGAAQFGAGGLGTDVINAISRYGAIPEGVYSGLMLGKAAHDHDALDRKLKSYLEGLLTRRPLPADWMDGFRTILDDHLGKVPETFVYGEKTYTPQSFASDVLKFSPNDYVAVTSFSHHPFYKPFILEVPDNFANAAYYNIPLAEMQELVDHALENGFSVMWDADVTNSNFNPKTGFALQVARQENTSAWKDPQYATEEAYDQNIRQQRYENLTTQDDHLMHIVGVETSKSGKKFYLVKNSYGPVGPFKGYIKVSPAYFAINTVSLVVPRDAMGDGLRAKLGLR